MGDAPGTFLEADVAHRTGTEALAGGLAFPTARMMIRTALDTVIQEDLQAKRGAEAQQPSSALKFHCVRATPSDMDDAVSNHHRCCGFCFPLFRYIVLAIPPSEIEAHLIEMAALQETVLERD